MTTTRSNARNRLASVPAVLLSALSCFAFPAAAQQAVELGEVQLMDPTLPIKAVPYSEDRLLFHVRTGVERAIVFPEPVLLVRSNPWLPGCDIVVDHDVVGFYATREFARKTIQLVGLETGVNYLLGIRASYSGLLQPLRITQPANIEGN